MKTGTIILGFIALIFGTDTILSLQSHATISEWFYLWLHTGWQASALFFSFVGLLFAHFWFFRPKSED